MSILDQIRNTTVADLENVPSHFDDLPRGHFRDAKKTGMIRIVEGADDLVHPMAGRGGGSGNSRPALPVITPAHNGDTCDNPKCCPNDGPADARTARQVEVMTSLIAQITELDADLGAATAKWTADATASGTYWTAYQGKDNPGTASIWIGKMIAKVRELKARPVAQTPVKSTAWAAWRDLAAKLVKVGGQHGARFAVETNPGSDNDLAFWWIVRNEGPQGVRYFIRQVIGGQGAVRVRMSPETMITIANKINAAGPMQAMVRYGQEIGSCGHCGRELTNEKSRAAGLGPHCRKGKGM